MWNWTQNIFQVAIVYPLQNIVLSHADDLHSLRSPPSILFAVHRILSVGGTQGCVSLIVKCSQYTHHIVYRYTHTALVVRALTLKGHNMW